MINMPLYFTCSFIAQVCDVLCQSHLKGEGHVEPTVYLKGEGHVEPTVHLKGEGHVEPIVHLKGEGHCPSKCTIEE